MFFSSFSKNTTLRAKTTNRLKTLHFFVETFPLAITIFICFMVLSVVHNALCSTAPRHSRDATIHPTVDPFTQASKSPKWNKKKLCMFTIRVYKDKHGLLVSPKWIVQENCKDGYDERNTKSILKWREWESTYRTRKLLIQNHVSGAWAAKETATTTKRQI